MIDEDPKTRTRYRTVFDVLAVGFACPDPQRPKPKASPVTFAANSLRLEPLISDALQEGRALRARDRRIRNRTWLPYPSRRTSSKEL
ncbi:hypothetical protein [Xanthomonas sp. SI]|uniref:hypothetical protein n=1 Tax=Xanthomonas sp. SI TaxID=2724123 RepID=UPI00163A0158|nr:hypothetical protein [Xanthomonas sp. SI]